MKPTKDNWIKAFKDKFEKVVERFDDGSYITEGVNPKVVINISAGKMIVPIVLEQTLTTKLYLKDHPIFEDKK